MNLTCEKVKYTSDSGHVKHNCIVIYQHIFIKNWLCASPCRSIPQERLDKINSELESDVMIRAIYDVKGIDMGNSLVRYKAELDFDGRELSRSYLDKQDLSILLEVRTQCFLLSDIWAVLQHIQISCLHLIPCHA